MIAATNIKFWFHKWDIIFREERKLKFYSLIKLYHLEENTKGESGEMRQDLETHSSGRQEEENK